MPSYQTNDPKGWCGDPRRGAALGRATIIDGNPHTFTGKLTLRRVRINAGGYDRNGTYFGVSPTPLWWCAGGDDDHEFDFVFRAANRDGAKFQVRQGIPGARFYR